MQRLPDNGHAHSPLPPAQRPAGNAASLPPQPDADPAVSSIGARGCASHSPCSLLPPPACPQYLPALVLSKIVDYLPFADQSRCARVCRHWHDCLPAPRQRLSRWLQQHAPVSWLANPH
ncbi:MAG: F-box-like domain-containing protein, partial [Kistimonas sp.]|nr:F-box-like domain-containing protein [Kistimonas sp.]